MTSIRCLKIASLLVCTLAFLSCTFGPKPVTPGSRNIEGLLLDAGFVRNLADSPEKLERMRSEVQRKVIPVQEEGQTYYLYADADICQCLYVGTESAFHRFEDLMYRANLERNTCIDDRLRSTQAEPWREFGALSNMCGER
jgi:hypothetical protein